MDNQNIGVQKQIPVKMPNVFTPQLLRQIADHLDNDASRVIVLSKDQMQDTDWLVVIAQIIKAQIKDEEFKGFLIQQIQQYNEKIAKQIENIANDTCESEGKELEFEGNKQG